MSKRTSSSALLILLVLVAVLCIRGLWYANDEEHAMLKGGTSSPKHPERQAHLNGKTGDRGQSPRKLGNPSSGMAQGALPASVLEFRTSAKVELQPGETLVVGGFKLPDGRQEFTFLSPTRIDSTGLPDPSGSDESGSFKISSQTITISQETALETGMDLFSSQNNGSYKHTEAWDTEQWLSFLSAASQTKDVVLRRAPSISARPGEKASIEIGGGELRPDNQYTLEASTDSTADGKISLDYSLLRRIPRNRQ